MTETLVELVARISADVSKLKTGLKSAEKEVTGFGGFLQRHERAITFAIGGMVAAVGAMAYKSIKAYAQTGDAIQEMSQRTGLGTVAISELKYAAELSGSSLQGLEVSIRKMSQSIIDAKNGLETSGRAFRDVGISVESLIGLKPEEQFLKIATAIASVGDETLRTALATDIFGARTGTQLLPMLADGAEGLNKMRQEAHDLGIVFDPEMADKASKMQDSFQKLEGSLNGLKFAFAEIAGPVVQAMAEDLTTVVKADWGTELRNTFEKIKETFVEAFGGQYLTLSEVRAAFDFTNQAALMAGKAIESTTIIVTKQSEVLATSKEVIDGVIVTTNLYTQSEIEAAKAAGLLVENVPNATDKVRDFQQAIEDAKEATDKAKDELKAISERFKEMMDRINYTGTSAQKFGVTMFDIYDAMNTLGYSIDDIRNKWGIWGDEIGSVEVALKALGLTAEEIDKILKNTTVSIATVRSNIADLQAAAKAAVGTPGEEEATLAYQRERQNERSRKAGKPAPYASGGIINRPTLALMGEKAPAIKEAIIPETMWGELGGKMMTIILELDGRVLSRAVMPYATEEIRLRSGIR